MVHPTLTQNCETTNESLQKCIKMAEPLIKDSQNVFPSTNAEINHVCNNLFPRTWSDFIACVKKYTDNCLNSEEKTDFNRAVGDSINVVHRMCTNEDYKKGLAKAQDPDKCVHNYACVAEAGNLIRSYPDGIETIEVCRMLCQKQEGCEHFTWYDENGAFPQSCFLYSYCNQKDNTTCRDCHYSGPKYCRRSFQPCTPIGGDFGGTWFCFPQIKSMDEPVPHGTRCIFKCPAHMAFHTCEEGRWSEIPGENQRCMCPSLNDALGPSDGDIICWPPQRDYTSRVPAGTYCLHTCHGHPKHEMRCRHASWTLKPEELACENKIPPKSMGQGFKEMIENPESSDLNMEEVITKGLSSIIKSSADEEDEDLSTYINGETLTMTKVHHRKLNNDTPAINFKYKLLSEPPKKDIVTDDRYKYKLRHGPTSEDSSSTFKELPLRANSQSLLTYRQYLLTQDPAYYEEEYKRKHLRGRTTKSPYIPPQKEAARTNHPRSPYDQPHSSHSYKKDDVIFSDNGSAYLPVVSHFEKKNVKKPPLTPFIRASKDKPDFSSLLREKKREIPQNKLFVDQLLKKMSKLDTESKEENRLELQLLQALIPSENRYRACKRAPLEVQHGEIECKNKGKFSSGSECTLKCFLGYVPQKHSKIKCEDGIWVNEESLKCTKSIAMIIGGWNPDLGLLSSVEIYSPAHHSCSNIYVAPLPAPRKGLIANWIDGAVVACGGYNQTAGSNVCWKFIPELNNWKEIEHTEIERHFAMSVSVGGDMYVLGGRDGNEEPVALGSVERLSLPAESWELMPEMKLSIERAYHCAVPLGHEGILLTGGYSWNSILNDVELLNTSNMEAGWARLKGMKTPRYLHSCGLVPNSNSKNPHVIISGGYSSEYLSSSEILNTETGEWSEAGSMMEPRQGAHMLVLNGRATIIGGFHSTDQYPDVVEQYDLDSGRWVPVSQRIKTRRRYFAAVEIPENLFSPHC